MSKGEAARRKLEIAGESHALRFPNPIGRHHASLKQAISRNSHIEAMYMVGFQFLVIFGLRVVYRVIPQLERIVDQYQDALITGFLQPFLHRPIPQRIYERLRMLYCQPKCGCDDYQAQPPCLMLRRTRGFRSRLPAVLISTVLRGPSSGCLLALPPPRSLLQ
jgi:hypothetical protein